MDHFILNKTKITDDKGHNFVLKTTTDAPSELKSDKNENNSVILEMELRP
ncbi:hypothetical protein IJU97_06290 [bacterium]|nr:hypothetical protein [bacterium]